jgi:2-isopropylmalate synthase
MALKTRADSFGGIDTGIKTDELSRSSRMVSRLTGYPVQFNKAVVGRNAFSHEASIHQHGVLRERTTYEIMDPAAVGMGESKLVLGKHSGRAAFKDALQKMGVEIHGEGLEAAFTRFKELADRKIHLSEADLEALVAEEVGGHLTQAFELVALDLHGGTSRTPTATVTMKINGTDCTANATGDGLVDASCKAIRMCTEMEGTLTDYNVISVTGGVDALGDVSLSFESSDGIKVSGRGLSTDVVEASARAFIAALNRVQRVRASGEDPSKVIRPGSLRVR